MSNSKDMRKLLKTLESHGLIVRLSKSNHYKVFRPGPNGSEQYLLTVPNTPSEYRSYKNTIAALRRAGVAV